MKRKHPLRRILLGTAATVAGVVALLALKQPAGGQNVAGPPAGQAPPPVAATAPSGAAGGQTLTGDVVDTQYGPVQVSVTMSGGKITAAQAVKTPNSGPRSEQIAKDSIPQLNQQAVSAAKVDTVSGATYTSEGYAKSLQSALDKAGTK
ncbi:MULTISPECIES: FMN-binding protein [Streptomyces]|uniref:FMN-binding protein n=1 Tax=Streptomyces botrytidirepellens TaxID=2486417 RepID=A0A3M8XBE0_9ACTN|nr:FMN-binding protein [Streptomyces botrytidirepellens]RNG38849.1 FMN-binding protein [Streptomyces botrytidirepellens]